MISFGTVQAILNTLPIGYYLGRKIECYLADDTATFFNPIEQKVQIGYRMLPAISAGTEEEIENDIRCALYHEVSHALLTPKTKVTDIFNIFEDERIETLLKDFYHRVNFKEFVKKVNGYKGEEPKTAKEMFYQIVRYRKGDKVFVDRVKDIIHEYKDINATYAECSYRVLRYKEAVKELYEDIVNMFEDIKSAEEERKKGKEETEEPKGTKGESESVKEIGKDESESESVKGFDEDESEDGMKDGMEDESEKDEWTEDEIKEIKRSLKEVFDNLFDVYVDKDFNEKVYRIIDRIARKKNMSGGAVNGYSGKLNPRLVGNGGKPDLYKWFEKSASVSGNRFSKVQLNLFVDVSGSFWDSETYLNQLIMSLIGIEKSEKDFNLNVIKMGNENKLAEKKDRLVRCCEGNFLTNDMIDLYNRVQAPQAMNYNVVVFDGDAQSFDGISGEEWITMRRENEKAWTAFNHPNCTIISDYGNKVPIEKHCPSAKTIFTSNYAEEFKENILKAMAHLFR